MGAVVVDQNMNGLRTFRNQALEQLFNTMLAVMLIVALGLFFFASRISSRIRFLRNQAEGMIDEVGRVRRGGPHDVRGETADEDKDAGDDVLGAEAVQEVPEALHDAGGVQVHV